MELSHFPEAVTKQLLIQSNLSTLLFYLILCSRFLKFNDTFALPASPHRTLHLFVLSSFKSFNLRRQSEALRNRIEKCCINKVMFIESRPGLTPLRRLLLALIHPQFVWALHSGDGTLWTISNR